jgi:hypothetical protein
MSTAYQQWTLAQIRSKIRSELLDPSGKFFSDFEINFFAAQYQDEIQQDYEFVWGTCTITTINPVVQISSISPAMSRLDAVYWSDTNTSRGYRLAGRNLEDLDWAHRDWRISDTDVPREIVQYDSTQLTIWPPPSKPAILTFEYPLKLDLVNDIDTMSLPIWAQWAVKPYVCRECYLRPGPVNDLKRALRYDKQYLREKARIKLLWDNWLPERYRRLKPSGRYELDILKPIVAFDVGNGTTSVPGGF